MTCTAKRIKSPPKSKTIKWFTPSHGLYVLGRDTTTDNYYASRNKEPTFDVGGNSQHMVEKVAGAILNMELKNVPRKDRAEPSPAA